MAAKIEKPKAGDPTNKLWETVAKCVQALNAWSAAKVSPETAGKFVFSEGNVVLDLSAFAKKLPDPPATGTYWLASINGVVSWQPTITDCP